MLKLKFDWRDVFRAPRAAFSLQRMWIQVLGLSVGFMVYLVFSYLSLMVSGYQLPVAWAQFGLLPCLFAIGDTFPWYAWALAGVGSLFLFFTMLITNTAVSRAIYMTSKGNSFYTWKESYAFAFRKLASIVLTPVSLFVLMGLMVLGALIIGLLGKIPFVGELGVSLLTILWLLGALILFFFAIVTLVAIILVPSIIATTDEDAFEAIFQSFSISWSQPWRFLFYEAITLVLAFFAMGVFAFFIKEAVMIMNTMFASFMGSDYINLANNGQAMVQTWTLLLENIVKNIYQNYSGFVFFSREFIKIPVQDLAVSVVISSYFYAASLLFVGAWVLSYGISAFTAGNTLAFMVLKKVKDEENLLERKDAEEETEEDEEEPEEQKLDTEAEKSQPSEESDKE